MIAPESTSTALAMRSELVRIEEALSEFEKITDGLAELAERYPTDLVYDVTTTKGMAEAIAHRAAWRDPRINVEKFRKIGKAPVLALGKNIDQRAAWLTEQLLIGEAAVDEQIKAEENRKEEIKRAKIASEFGRVEAIQTAIAEIHMDAMAVVGKPSSVIRERLDEMRQRALDPLVFQESMAQAQEALRTSVGKLETTLAAALHTEAEAARVAAERAELEQLRAAAAEQKRKDEAAAAEARKAEDARIAAERKAAAEEQKRLDAEAAVARAEADRVAAAERKAAKDKQEAELAEQRAQLAAAQKVEADKRAKAEAKRIKAEAAEKKLRDAAGLMLAALQAVASAGDLGEHLHRQVHDAIAAAT